MGLPSSFSSMGPNSVQMDMMFAVPPPRLKTCPRTAAPERIHRYWLEAVAREKENRTLEVLVTSVTPAQLIAGKTLGVVGLGAIGSMVANVALELGMKVAGYDPALSVEAAWRLSNRVEKVDSLEALLRLSDFVTLHVPAIDQTHHLIDHEALRRFKPGAKLLNFAREEIVDVDAVVTALNERRLGGYITDFPVPALLGRPDTLLFPHLGASTAEAEENCSVMAAEQLIDFLENGNIVNSVNYPRTRMARGGGYRITFANDNVPRVLGTVLSVLANHNINVLDMVNRSLYDTAYNIIDVETKPTPEIVHAIAAADGVKHVRVI